MKKVTTILAAAALVGLYAGIASAAPCSYNTSPQKGLKSSMIRAFAKCPSTEHDVNTHTEGNVPACKPITARHLDGEETTYEFAPDGRCTVQTQGKLVKDCSKLGAEAGECSVVYVKGKCQGIVHASDHTTLIDGEATDLADNGWTLSTLSRASFDDDTNGPMTVIDFPASFNYGPAKKGQIKLKSNSVESLTLIVGPTAADLPTCSSIEVVDLIIKDPAGLPFARPGGATVPEE